MSVLDARFTVNALGVVVPAGAVRATSTLAAAVPVPAPVAPLLPPQAPGPGPAGSESCQC